MESNQNKHYYNLSWLVYLFIGVIGFFLVRWFFDELNLQVVYDLEMNIYLYDVLILIYGFISCGIVYNLGKLIFSLLCGYKLIYFNLYFLGIEKINGKIKPYFGAKYDLSCRVVMEPTKENPKTTLPLLGGTILSLAVLGITYGLIFGLNTEPTTKFFFLVSSMFYFFMIILSLVPFRMDSLNDGFALKLLKDKNKKNIYLHNLKNIKALYSDGELEYLDVQEENDPIVLEAFVYNYYKLISDKKIEEACELASKCYEYRKNIISEEHAMTLVIGHVYNMCIKNDIEGLKSFYKEADINLKHVVNETKNLEQVKTALYIFAFIDEDKEGYVKIINDVKKLEKKYKYKKFIEIENEMIKNVINEVQEKKPEWNEYELIDE